MTAFSYPATVEAGLKKADSVFLIAPQKAYSSGWHKKILPKALADSVDLVVSEIKPGSGGSSHEIIRADSPRRLCVGVLPDKGSRHNSPTRAESMFTCAKRAPSKGSVLGIVAVDDPDHGLGALVGLARAFPEFDRRTSKDKKEKSLGLLLSDHEGSLIPVDRRTRDTIDGVRWASRLVDTPTADMTTEDFVREALRHVKGTKGVQSTVIVGEALAKKGLGGIYAVGQAAMVAPRMLVLEYSPTKSKRTVALVGKGVVYDTGGLSLKPTTSMSTMKGDMAGAAATVAAFRVLAESRVPFRVVAVAALAENAIGPNSFRNDDILTLHSGHTVEINNTDAEGRLLLGDAVSWVGREKKPDLIMNIATLTGAQLVATGYRHGAVVSNRQGLEDLAVLMGRATGDLVFPLPFCPEFFQGEFKSAVADMKNSVGNRSNAQSSCAAQFVYNQIDDLDIPWLHFDIAGPSLRDERATGFGVALLAACASEFTTAQLKS